MIDVDQGSIRITKDNYKEYLNTLFFKALQEAIRSALAFKTSTVIVLTPDGRFKVFMDGLDRLGYSIGYICTVDRAMAEQLYYPLGFNRQFSEPDIIIPDTKNSFLNSDLVKGFYIDVIHDPEAYEEYKQWVEEMAETMETNAEKAFKMFSRNMSGKFRPIEKYKALRLEPETLLPNLTVEDAEKDELLISY